MDLDDFRQATPPPTAELAQYFKDNPVPHEHRSEYYRVPHAASLLGTEEPDWRYPRRRLFFAFFRGLRYAVVALTGDDALSAVEYAARDVCQRCSGSGKRITDRSVRLCLEYGDPMEIGTCDDCGGTGRNLR